MLMQGIVTVLSARRYSMEDETTGELVQGVIVKFVGDWAGLQKENSNGVEVMKGNLPYAAWETLPAFPADCMAQFRMRAGKGDHPVLDFDSLDFKGSFSPRSALVSPNKDNHDNKDIEKK